MKNPFHKKDDGIVILSKPEPLSCGGRYATQDTNAPKQIESSEMIFFSATSCLNRENGEGLSYISAFAAPLSDGVFLFLQKGEGFGRRGETESAWTAVKEDIFPSLVNLVRECDLAKDNGYHSTTHGLPQNFGGQVEILYAGGEKISYSDNQQPILSAKAGDKIASLFAAAMRGEKLALPGIESLIAIRFREERENGGFTEAVLTLLPDGTGENRKKSRYDDEKVYESVKTVSGETLGEIKKTITDTGILFWSSLPESGYLSVDRKMTFIFEDGTEITVVDGKKVPDPIRHGFFDIQLEITTKH